LARQSDRAKNLPKLRFNKDQFELRGSYNANINSHNHQVNNDFNFRTLLPADKAEKRNKIWCKGSQEVLPLESIPDTTNHMELRLIISTWYLLIHWGVSITAKTIEKISRTNMALSQYPKLWRSSIPHEKQKTSVLIIFS
jgi:hypothetical protein